MTSSSGIVVGYFIALCVLICGVPFIGILIRVIRRKKFAQDKSQLIEVFLSTRAREAISKSRSYVVDNFVEESRESLVVKVSDRVARAKSADSMSTTNLLAATDKYYLHALRQSHIYWGLEDILFPEGRVWCLSLPDGLAEDFIFYALNNINPLSFVFSDEDHPETIPVRLAMYCTAQAFVLFVYVVIENSTMQTVIGMLLSPLILFIQYLFKYMLFCPCLQNDDTFEEEVTRTNLNKKKIEAGCVLIARWGGILIALPFLLSLVFFLVVLSIFLKDGHSSDNILARFLWGGIVFPFILDILQASVNYWWFVTPMHLKVCGFCVMTINSWTELRLREKKLFDLKDLSRAKRMEVLSQLKQSKYSPADFFHVSCHCMKYSGLAVDFHHDVDICAPSCYCGRCCDAMSSLYWEEENEFLITGPTFSKSEFQSGTIINDDVTQDVRGELCN